MSCNAAGKETVKLNEKNKLQIAVTKIITLKL